MNAPTVVATFAVGIWLGGLGMWWRLAKRSDDLDEWEQSLRDRQREWYQAHGRLAFGVSSSVAAQEPCDWDGEAFCVERCGRPATHQRLTGMVDELPVYELVCCSCSLK